ncbi:hypothetical protein HMPREF0972_02444 [Actinomyces sp. oral taxon 848 str. F0332]|nr:hypothetical protein HMPREF0972_02444 [Actinomyces sp. oral taxon 848 str. F0332]
MSVWPWAPPYASFASFSVVRLPPGAFARHKPGKGMKKAPPTRGAQHETSKRLPRARFVPKGSS